MNHLHIWKSISFFLSFTDGVDYVLESPSIISRTINEFPVEISFLIINDCDNEENESFAVSLNSVDQGVTVNDGITFVTIMNDFVNISGELLCVCVKNQYCVIYMSLIHMV